VIVPFDVSITTMGPAAGACARAVPCIPTQIASAINGTPALDHLRMLVLLCAVLRCRLVAG
jgi:hypothetical protein